jgi:CBS domain-containing protein
MPRDAWARRAARALEAGRDPLVVGAGLSRRAAALLRLLVRRATAALGPAPAACAWLALGGVARREAAPDADLDHALVHAGRSILLGGRNLASPQSPPWFAAAAGHVAEGLQRAGVPACPGGWSAERRAGDLAGWRARLAAWSADPAPAALLDLAVLLDARRAAGGLDVRALQEEVAALAAAPPLRAALAEAALSLRCRAPLAVQLRPARPLDLKRHAIGPLVAAARVLGVAADPSGAAARGTLARIQAARAAGLVGPDTAEGAAAALRALTGLRLRAGLTAVLAGARPSPVVVPAALAAEDRSALVGALAAVQRVQAALERLAG